MLEFRDLVEVELRNNNLTVPLTLLYGIETGHEEVDIVNVVW